VIRYGLTRSWTSALHSDLCAVDIRTRLPNFAGRVELGVASGIVLKPDMYRLCLQNVYRNRDAWSKLVSFKSTSSYKFLIGRPPILGKGWSWGSGVVYPWHPAVLGIIYLLKPIRHFAPFTSQSPYMFCVGLDRLPNLREGVGQEVESSTVKARTTEHNICLLKARRYNTAPFMSKTPGKFWDCGTRPSNWEKRVGLGGQNGPNRKDGRLSVLC
jgi:hypothetical protein